MSNKNKKRTPSAQSYGQRMAKKTSKVTPKQEEGYLLTNGSQVRVVSGLDFAINQTVREMTKPLKPTVENGKVELEPPTILEPKTRFWDIEPVTLSEMSESLLVLTEEGAPLPAVLREKLIKFW